MKNINYYYNDEHPLHPLIGKSYANEGSLPPLNALRIEPDFTEGFCPCEKDGGWLNAPDYRGVTVYDKETARSVEINDVGELPANLTLLVPKTQFDKWNGSEWITDLAAQRQSEIDAVKAEKYQLELKAKEMIEKLSDAIDLNMALEGDEARLTAWRKYRVLLNQMDASKVPDIDWPVAPAL